MRISNCVPILALCSSLLAGDLLTPGEQLQRELRAALSSGDAKVASALLGEVGGLYRFPASSAEAAALLKLAGEAVRHADRAIAKAGVGALGDTGSAAAAAALKPLLRSREPLALAAVHAAGKLGHASLIAPLLDLAKSSADMTLADQAYLALGSYAASPVSVRRRVTERVLSLCQSASRSKRRWRRLRAPGLRALQRLMGRRLNSVTQFADWWRFVKSRKDPF